MNLHFLYSLQTSGLIISNEIHNTPSPDWSRHTTMCVCVCVLWHFGIVILLPCSARLSSLHSDIKTHFSNPPNERIWEQEHRLTTEDCNEREGSYSDEWEGREPRDEKKRGWDGETYSTQSGGKQLVVGTEENKEEGEKSREK